MKITDENGKPKLFTAKLYSDGTISVGILDENKDQPKDIITGNTIVLKETIEGVLTELSFPPVILGEIEGYLDEFEFPQKTTVFIPNEESKNKIKALFDL